MPVLLEIWFFILICVALVKLNFVLCGLKAGIPIAMDNIGSGDEDGGFLYVFVKW